MRLWIKIKALVKILSFFLTATYPHVRRSVPRRDCLNSVILEFKRQFLSIKLERYDGNDIPSTCL